MPRGGRGGAPGARRFGVAEALADLRRHGVIGADAVREVPLRAYGDTAVVAVDRRAGPELVVRVDKPGMLSAVGRFHEAYRGVSLIPALRHADRDHRFLAYDWAAGELGRGMDPPPDKAGTLLVLGNGLLCHYVPVESADACWLHELHRPEKAPPGARHRALIEEVVIALYSRVGTFVGNRPADVPAHLDAWAHWTDLLARA